MAIYSVVEELIPARLRGQLALFVCGTYWGGAIAVSLVAPGYEEDQREQQTCYEQRSVHEIPLTY